jgi:hypothetical protein
MSVDRTGGRPNAHSAMTSSSESRSDELPAEQPARGLLDLYLEHEWLRYVISGGVVVVVMLLVPALLNNMFLTAVVLLAGVALLPELMRKRP